MNVVGRKRKGEKATKRLNLRFNGDLYEALEKFAKRRGISVTEALEMATRLMLEAE